MLVVVGVDGGATKTVCVLLDAESRKELAKSTGSASNWSAWHSRERSLTSKPQSDPTDLITICRNSVGLERAVEAVADTVDGRN